MKGASVEVEIEIDYEITVERALRGWRGRARAGPHSPAVGLDVDNERERPVDAAGGIHLEWIAPVRTAPDFLDLY